MYHSYLRGKQYELLAIRSCLEKISQAEIVPIIEPVRDTSDNLIRCIKEASSSSASIIVVANPQHGELVNNQVASEAVIEGAISVHPELELGYIVHEGITFSQLSQLRDRFPNQPFSIIHFGRFSDSKALLGFAADFDTFNKHIFIETRSSQSYRKKFTDFPRVIIADPFTKRDRNVDYGEYQDEFFSDLHNNYIDQGYQGFGDFSIIGDNYSEGGGQAITAALHVTYPKEEDEIYVRHFLSEYRTVPEDVKILLDEALERLSEFLQARTDILEWSSACSELMDIYNTNKNTNLAYMKKMTIKHHFELMHMLLKS